MYEIFQECPLILETVFRILDSALQEDSFWNLAVRIDELPPFHIMGHNTN